ncbi:transposase [Halochromatium sp.]
MPRRARIVVAGYPMHVILRGIDRSAVFFEDHDRRFFLERLARAAEDESVAVHAYVLMGNHLHLLMTAAEAQGIAKVMKQVAQRYVQRLNRRYGRTGGLFEGRFRSSVIDADGYLLACMRYIELNPVRAAMVTAPGDYPWSSYRANALGEADPVVKPHALYAGLADAADARRAAYRRLFEDVLSEELLTQVRDCTNGGFVLGPPQMEQQVAAMLGRPVSKGTPGRPRKQREETEAGKQGALEL